MTVETAERRFGFKFEEAILQPPHRSEEENKSCNCFPCRVCAQWQDFKGERDWTQYTGLTDAQRIQGKRYAYEAHDPANPDTMKNMSHGSDAYVIWNGCVFWIV